MSESQLRDHVRKGLRQRGILTTHHEDMLNSGIPDLSYTGLGVHGWIELKHAHAWPKRPGTPLRLKRYTLDQKAFLFTRGRLGGHCWLLLRVGKEHLLLFNPLQLGIRCMLHTFEHI